MAKISKILDIKFTGEEDEDGYKKNGVATVIYSRFLFGDIERNVIFRASEEHERQTICWEDDGKNLNSDDRKTLIRMSENYRIKKSIEEGD